MSDNSARRIAQTPSLLLHVFDVNARKTFQWPYTASATAVAPSITLLIQHTKQYSQHSYLDSNHCDTDGPPVLDALKCTNSTDYRTLSTDLFSLCSFQLLSVFFDNLGHASLVFLLLLNTLENFLTPTLTFNICEEDDDEEEDEDEDDDGKMMTRNENSRNLFLREASPRARL